jgi:hypothetical protein
LKYFSARVASDRDFRHQSEERELSAACLRGLEIDDDQVVVGEVDGSRRR